MKTSSTSSEKIRAYTILLAVSWTIIILVLMALDVYGVQRQMFQIARTEALTNIQKDLAYRLWNTSKGGVYVPLSPDSRPNPYLKVPNREVTTLDGQTLTLINPAYMTRQVHEMSLAKYGFRAHLTSLNPLRPDNAADAWETQALQSFEQGQTEASTVETMSDNQEYFRLMVPFYTDQGCLKCHAAQGYRAGDVRGGLSISIPIRRYDDLRRASLAPSLIGFGILWLLGLAGILGVSRDLKRHSLDLERALAHSNESEERFRTLVNSFNDMVYTLDHEQRHVSLFGDWVAKAGMKPEDFLGKTALEILGPEAAQVHIEANRRALAGEPITYEWAVPQGGQIRYYQTVVSPLRDNSGAIVGGVGVGRDITERELASQALKEAQTRLLQSEKMAAIGQVMAGIAHELNNPLTSVVLFCELAQQSTTDSQTRQTLAKAIDEAKRAGRIVHSLLGFARQKPASLQVVDINALLGESLEIATGDLRAHDIQVELNLSQTLPVLQLDPTQMKQVFLNLIHNARQAMQANGSGRLLITSMIGVAPANDRHYPDQQIVRLTFEDNGPGIPENLLNRIFDPFFTTKAVGEGTGLGLATCHNIIAAHHGAIWAENRVEGGARFVIELPVKQQ